MLVAQRKPNFNMLRLIGAVQNQKKSELGHWVLVTDGHPSIQAYQVGHPSQIRKKNEVRHWVLVTDEHPSSTLL